MSNFYEDYSEAWEAVISELGIETDIPEAHEFGDMLDNHSKDAEVKGREQLQPWLYLAEQYIFWLALFNLTLMGMLFHKEGYQDKEFNEILVSLSAITALANSQAISIRKLCILGQDTSARIILRSFVETIDISLMIIHDASIRKEYVKCQSSDESRVFWNKHSRQSKLSKFYKLVFQNLNLPEDTAIEFEKSRISISELATQATHSSWLASVFTALPIPYTMEDENAMGRFFGTVSQFSKTTLFTLCEVIYSLSYLGFSYLTNNYSNYFVEYIKMSNGGNYSESLPFIMINLSAVMGKLHVKYHNEYYEKKDNFLEEMANNIFQLSKQI